MTRHTGNPIRPADVWRTVVTHPLRWLLPVVLFTVGGLAYALLRPATWEATQAMIVRDEAGGNLSRPGKFNHVEEMKTVQETVLELIKSRSVLIGALKEVGAPADYTLSEPWPAASVVEAVQQSVKLTPPKGAEFGKTEVFYLKAQAPERQRAIDLAAAICKQLELQFDNLRYNKYQSVINELTKTVALAQDELDLSTDALSAVERQAGPDLAELRSLNEAPTNESGLRRMSTEIETELRTYRASVNSNQELLKLLQAAVDDPGRLLASPSRLLEAQPALRRLKDGLVDAQLRTAQILGTMSPAHPAAKAALVAEQEIGQHVHDEIAIAVKGVEIDLRLAEDRVAALEAQRTSVQARLNHLAEIRAEYSNLATATKHRTEVLKLAQQELSEARASQAAARTSSLITLVDTPDAGTKPAGPGRTTIALGGLLAGLMAGAGVIFLTVESQSGTANAETHRVAVVAAPQPQAIMPAAGEPVIIMPTPPVVATVSPSAATVVMAAAPLPASSPASSPAKPCAAERRRPAPRVNLTLKQALEKLGDPAGQR